MDAENPINTIFILGSLHVYWRPSVVQLLDEQAPTMVFWTDSKSNNVYGPFASTYEAMKHYTWFVAMQRIDPIAEDTANKPVGTVLHVNFNTRQIVKYELPGEDDV